MQNTYQANLDASNAKNAGISNAFGGLTSLRQRLDSPTSGSRATFGVLALILSAWASTNTTSLDTASAA
jgi:hypothetical protein